MLPETVILGGNHRLNKIGGNAVKGNDFPAADDHQPFTGGRKYFSGRGFDNAAQRLGHAWQITHGNE